MSAKYRYDHRSIKRRHIVSIVLGSCFLMVTAIISVVALDIKRNSESPAVVGTGRVVGQVVGDETEKITIDEATFKMQLPKYWKETERQNSANEQSITWNLVKKNTAGRTLKLYIDKIPSAKSVNRLLPVTAQGTGLTPGEVSDNCAAFTVGGTLDVQKAQSLGDARSKSQGVDFICSLSNVILYQVGTGSTEGINQVSVTGPKEGTHKYFFVYTDQHIQQDPAVLLDAIASFQAK